MKTNKLELANVVEITYSSGRDKNEFHPTYLTAMIAVPEESLPPMSEEDKKLGRKIDIYLKKAAEILTNEMGPIRIYSIVSRFVGDVTLVCGKTIDIKEE